MRSWLNELEPNAKIKTSGASVEEPQRRRPALMMRVVVYDEAGDVALHYHDTVSLCAGLLEFKSRRPPLCFGCARPMNLVRRTLRFGRLPELCSSSAEPVACVTLRKAPHPRAAWPILKQSWLLRCLVPAAPPAATRVRLSSNYPTSGLGVLCHFRCRARLAGGQSR